MFLNSITVEGLRSSADDPIEVPFQGRSSVLIGANGAGKATITDAICIAHGQVSWPPRTGLELSLRS